MSSTSSATSPDDTSTDTTENPTENLTENPTEDTSENPTAPLPASADTQPLTQPPTQPLTQPLTQPPTMPLPASDGVATDVLSTGEAPDDSVPDAPSADAETTETEAMAVTDTITSPASSSASNQDGFSTAFDAAPFGQDGRNGRSRSASADSAPASSAPDSVWSAGTVAGKDQQPQAPSDIRGSTLLWGAFLLLVGGLLIAAGLGLRFDFTTTAIVCLAGLGALLVVAALIPKRRHSTKA
ncbi:hypothetical protein [Actinomyces sp. ZJ308]|uniref:hypothetical protein n=1 Tax=Actinomyces sp. ZJ308 TaxID=2708342 RepID=UPI0014248919|nr:hypothetical protein [Actinomyces sp. ZJ308]